MARRRAGAMISPHSWHVPYSPPRRRSSASARRLARSTSRLRVAKFISRSSLTWMTSTSSASWLVSPTLFITSTERAAPPRWRMRSIVRLSSDSSFFLISSMSFSLLGGSLDGYPHPACRALLQSLCRSYVGERRRERRDIRPVLGPREAPEGTLPLQAGKKGHLIRQILERPPVQA